MAQPRCLSCGRWFEPEPSMGERQVTCLATACQAERKRVLGQQWRETNPERTLGRQEKVRAWAAENDYRRKWRADHPDYVERNLHQTRELMRRRREQQRQARGILADPVGYLEGLKEQCGPDVCKTGTRPVKTAEKSRINPERPTVFAKQELGMRPLVGIVDYLLAREVFAKQEGLDGDRAAEG